MAKNFLIAHGKVGEYVMTKRPKTSIPIPAETGSPLVQPDILQNATRDKYMGLSPAHRIRSRLAPLFVIGPARQRGIIVKADQALGLGQVGRTTQPAGFVDFGEFTDRKGQAGSSP